MGTVQLSVYNKTRDQVRTIEVPSNVVDSITNPNPDYDTQQNLQNLDQLMPGDWGWNLDQEDIYVSGNCGRVFKYNSVDKNFIETDEKVFK